MFNYSYEISNSQFIDYFYYFNVSDELSNYIAWLDKQYLKDLHGIDLINKRNLINVKKGIKSNLISGGMYEEYKNAKIYDYLSTYVDCSSDLSNFTEYNQDCLVNYQNSKQFCDTYLDDSSEKLLSQLHNSLRQMRKRCSKRINSILSYCADNVFFLTLTFNDTYLSTHNAITRRKDISRFLKSISPCYVANIDFGIDDTFTHREHYHAIAYVPDISVYDDVVQNEETKEFFTCVRLTGYEFGISHCELIDNRNHLMLSSYINKVVNHAFKLGTGLNTRLIYSRGFADFKINKSQEDTKRYFDKMHFKEEVFERKFIDTIY